MKTYHNKDNPNRAQRVHHYPASRLSLAAVLMVHYLLRHFICYGKGKETSEGEIYFLSIDSFMWLLQLWQNLCFPTLTFQKFFLIFNLNQNKNIGTLQIKSGAEWEGEARMGISILQDSGKAREGIQVGCKNVSVSSLSAAKLPHSPSVRRGGQQDDKFSCFGSVQTTGRFNVSR